MVATVPRRVRAVNGREAAPHATALTIVPHCMHSVRESNLGSNWDTGLSDRRTGSLAYGIQTQHTPLAPIGIPQAPVSEVTEHPRVVRPAI